MKENVQVFSIEDVMDVPKEYEIVSVPKLNLSDSVRNYLDTNKMTYQELAEKAEVTERDVLDIMQVNDYRFEVLLKVLHAMELSFSLATTK